MRRPLPMLGGLPVQHHTGLGASTRPLSRVPVDGNIEVTAPIAAIRQSSGFLRVLLQDAAGEAALARLSTDRIAAADQALGRPLRDGDQVQVRGTVIQEPGTPTAPRSIDVFAIRVTKA
ncbi:hypothetical protein [Streptomyces sp. NPDC093591]|uniref:hypothetical protein n=1 Tax=Streptomyces sp. NPDC093591 TaxID=3366044 RepID=UPI00381A6B4E